MSDRGMNSRKEKALKSGLFGFVMLILLALIGSLAFQWILSLALHTSVPLYTPISRSMEPTLRVGDLLIICGGLKAEDIHASPKNGDIIVFKNPDNPEGMPVVHRAIKKFWKNGKWYFITKGDNNHRDDYWLFGWIIPEDYIIGKVIFVIPKLGYVFRGLDEIKLQIGGFTVTLRMILIALDIAALLYLQLADYRSEDE
mgnify:CR=1 FL=1